MTELMGGRFRIVESTLGPENAAVCSDRSNGAFRWRNAPCRYVDQLTRRGCLRDSSACRRRGGALWRGWPDGRPRYVLIRGSPTVQPRVGSPVVLPNAPGCPEHASVPRGGS